MKDSTGNLNKLGIGLSVSITCVVGTALLLSYICLKKRKVSRRAHLSNRRHNKTLVDPKNENEGDYDSIEDLDDNRPLPGDQEVNQTPHSHIRIEHILEINAMQCLELADEQTNSPPLPPRPHPSQYIELGLVPISKNDNPLHSIAYSKTKVGIDEHLQEETNFDQTNNPLSDQSVNSLLRTTNISFELNACKMSEIAHCKVDSDNKIDEHNEALNPTMPSNDIDEGTSGRLINIYDTPIASYSHLEHNTYTSYTDGHHTIKRVHGDFTNADNDGYVIPSEPIIYTDSPDCTQKTNDCIEMLDQVLSTDNNVRSDNESYIYPIDPDDQSVAMLYGYQTWDGADIETNVMQTNKMPGNLKIMQQEIYKTETEGNMSSINRDK